MPVTVHNRATDRTIAGRHEWIMRPRTLGNPFALGVDGTRAQVILKYRHWLWGHVKSGQGPVFEKLRDLARIARTNDLRLMCCCKPQACHGDVIKACIEWMEREGLVGS